MLSFKSSNIGTLLNYLEENEIFTISKSERAFDRLQEDEVEADPKIGTRQISRQFEVSQSKMGRVLRNNNLHPYRIQQVQRLHLEDEISRCNNLLSK